MRPGIDTVTILGEYVQEGYITGFITDIIGDEIKVCNYKKAFNGLSLSECIELLPKLNQRAFTLLDKRQIRPYMAAGWIGLDLDGTFAQSTARFDLDSIPPPNPYMVNILWRCLRSGYEVKVFTARAYEHETQVPLIHNWLTEHKLPLLGVTNLKDKNMIALFDDRAINVNRATGVSDRINQLIDLVE